MFVRLNRPSDDSIGVTSLLHLAYADLPGQSPATAEASRVRRPQVGCDMGEGCRGGSPTSFDFLRVFRALSGQDLHAGPGEHSSVVAQTGPPARGRGSRLIPGAERVDGCRRIDRVGTGSRD